jgi:hypothetical protein
MNLLPIFAISLATVFLASYFSTASENITEIHKRGAKLFYDRIEVGVEPVRVQRCTMPGRIWYRNACWLPEKIAANAG